MALDCDHVERATPRVKDLCRLPSGLVARLARHLAVLTSHTLPALNMSAADAVADYNLGLSLARDGEPVGAIEAYQRAERSGHGDVAAKAAFNLAIALTEQGEFACARAGYERAIASGSTPRSSLIVWGHQEPFSRRFPWWRSAARSWS